MKSVKHLLVAAVLICCSAAFAAKPVGILSGSGWEGVGELTKATVFNPQWTSEKPLQITFSGGEFDKISALVYMHGGGIFRFRKFDKKFIADLEKFVASGGTFITLINGGTYAGELKTKGMAKLLGAENFTTFQGRAAILDKSWADCGKIPEVFEHMLAPQGKDSSGKLVRSRQIALSGLTTAKTVIGNTSGSLVTVNNFGKGKVYFINIRLTESLTSYKQYYHNRANAAWEQYLPFAKKLHSIIMECKPALSKEKREIWDPIPLGPKAKPLKITPRTPKKLVSNRTFTKLEGADIELASNGQPQAILIIQRVGDRGAFMALNKLLKNMCGVTLPTTHKRAVSEKNGVWHWRKKPFKTLIRFEVGEKINIKAGGNLIVITAPNPQQGIQTFMREILGYRMLWPGEYGEVYTKTDSVKFAPFELTDHSSIRQRYIRNGLSNGAREWVNPQGETIKVHASEGTIKNCNIIGLDVVEAIKCRSQHHSWYAPQRLGGTLNEGGGANFYKWSTLYKDKKELFALQFETGRKMKTSHVRICKSNPETIKLAAREAVEKMKLPRNKNVKYYRFSPSDGGYDIMCMCENCRKWDPQDGQAVTSRVFLGRNRPVYRYVRMTDRVLRFTCEAIKEMQKSRPDVKGVYLAYSSYLTPPEYYHDFPKDMLVNFVGGEYLNADSRQRDLGFWKYWSSKVDELCWRPNFLGAGAGMPFIYTKLMAQDLKYFASTGMVGGDFDTMPHHWATQGLTYYVLATLLWDPSANLDDIINDYCEKGFGSAAKEMKQYYEYCEKLTDEYRAAGGISVKQHEDITEIPATRFGRFCRVFTPQEFEKLEALLNAAREKVAADSIERKRIDFVGVGIAFFKKNSEFARKYYRTPSKQRKTLIPDINKLVEDWKVMFARHPFAINLTALVDNYYYEFFRNCGWKPVRPFKK